MNKLIGETKLIEQLTSNDELIENILINVDSKFRNNKKFPNPGHFVYDLNETFKNIVYIRLSSIELPTTNYTFASQYNNDTFNIIIDGNMDKEYIISIKEGNYTSELIINYIQAELDNINTEISSQLSIMWDEINYKVTIQNNTPFTIICNNDTEHESLGAHLGFLGSNTSYLFNNQQQSYNLTTLTYVYAWTGENFLHVNKDQYCFLKVNDYGVIYNNLIDKSILAKILLYDSQFVFDTGSNFLTKMYKFKQPINISRFDIELINQFGKTIQMGSVDFSMTLELGQLYNNRNY